MPHYKYLSELGEHYDSEETVPLMHGGSTLRQVVLKSLEAKLLQAIAAVDNLILSLKTQGGPLLNTTGSIKDRAKMFQQVAVAQQGKSKIDLERETERVEALRAVVAREKRNLILQGAVFRDDGSIDWGASAKLVVYDRNLVAQDTTRIRFNNRRLFMDNAFLKPLDTKDMTTVFSGLGHAIYVMSVEGNLHTSSHAIGYRHHSSLLAGGTVAGAGELKATGGRLDWISNKSGHYQPDLAHFLQVLHQLQKKNVDLSTTRVSFFSSSGRQNFATVGDFLATLKPEDDFSYAKLIAYLKVIPFDQFALLIAPRNWRWVTDIEYHTQNKRGVVDTISGAPVPHKMVRQFLKGLGRTAVVDTKSGYGR